MVRQATAGRAHRCHCRGQPRTPPDSAVATESGSAPEQSLTGPQAWPQPQNFAQPRINFTGVVAFFWTSKTLCYWRVRSIVVRWLLAIRDCSSISNHGKVTYAPLFSLCSLRLFSRPMTFLCALYRLCCRQQDLSPSELIKINVCAWAACGGKESWLWGAHHWRGRVKSLNKWGARLFRCGRNINRNNEVVAGFGVFMRIRTQPGPLDLCRIFCTLRPLFCFTSSPSWNTQGVLGFSEVKKLWSWLSTVSPSGVLAAVLLLNTNDSRLRFVS